MSQRMAARLPLHERLDTAAQLAVRARVFFDVWWFYENVETRPIVKKTWERFDQFCIFDTHAHILAFTVQIAALFDKRKRTISFGNLINELESTGTLSSQALTKPKDDFRCASLIADKVKILRHNLFAHRSASMSYEAAFRAANLTPTEIQELTEIALRIANALRSVLGMKWVSFNGHPRHDLETMFRRLSQPTLPSTSSVVN